MKQRVEIMISFRDMVYMILRKWRMLVILALVCALACGAYSYIKSADSSTKTLTMQSQLTDLTSEEAMKVKTAVALQKLYQTKNQNLAASYVSQMDENRVETITLQYFVTVPSKQTYDYTKDLLRAYVQSVRTAAYYENFTQEGNEYGLTQADLDTLVQVETTGRSLLITLKSSDSYDTAELLCSRLSTTAKEILEQKKNSFQNMYGAHDLVLTSESISTCSDQEIADAKLAKREAVETAEKDAQNTYKSLSANEKIHVDAILTLDSYHGAVVGQSVSKKMVLIGLLLGLVVAVILAICQFVWSRRLQTVAELTQGFELNVFGCFTEESVKPLHGLDLAIARAQYHASLPSEKTAKAAMLLRMASLLEKEGLNSVVLTGLGSHIQLAGWTKLLCEQVGTECKVSEVAHIEEDLTTILSAQALILVLRLGQDNRRRLEETLLMCKEQKLNVMGVITVI